MSTGGAALTVCFAVLPIAFGVKQIMNLAPSTRNGTRTIFIKTVSIAFGNVMVCLQVMSFAGGVLRVAVDVAQIGTTARKPVMTSYKTATASFGFILPRCDFFPFC